MSDILIRARALLHDRLPPEYIASWEEHPAQSVLVELIAEVEHLSANRRLLGQANYLLARIVATANLGAIDGTDGFVDSYNLPVGPIHKAIPFLQEQGIVVTTDGQIKNGPEQAPR